MPRRPSSPKPDPSPAQPSFDDLPVGPVLSRAAVGNTPAEPARPLSVTELTGHIKGLLERDDLLSDVRVQGEISNLVCASSGHAYLTLKDEHATIRAVVWAGTRKRIRTELSNGALVVATGSISVYAPRGEYQLSITDLRPAGLGALYEAFERLKQKLAAEGLFDEGKKKPIPLLPRGVGVVTSPTGAVVKDIYRVIRRRFPTMPIYLVPVKVQGEGSASQIAEGIRRLDADPRVDVIIIARGGGSLEDLWAFNEELTARAIAAAIKPVVSGVGHETDTTIADFVADKRAATPSVAAELVVPIKADLAATIAERAARLARALRNRIELERRRLARALACRFFTRPSLLVAERRLILVNRARELDVAFRDIAHRARHRLDLLRANLSAMDPRRPLARGYAFATDETGAVIASVSQTAPGRRLCLQLSDGQLHTLIESIDGPAAEKGRP